MSVDALLDDAFTRILGKAHQEFDQQNQLNLRSATINFEWNGGGQPLTTAIDPLTLYEYPLTTDPVLVEVPFDATIVWAHMYAGDSRGNPIPISTMVDLTLSSLLTFGAQTPVYGIGARPEMVAESSVDLPLTGWQLNLVTGDTLMATPFTFTGVATWFALTLLIRTTQVPLGVEPIVDNNGAQIVDNAGNLIVLRS